MTEKGAQPDRPDITVLPRAPALGQVWHIGPAQVSIIIGPVSQGGRQRAHPLPIIGCSGVGRITMVDCDNVEVFNLHWQVIHTEGGRGRRNARSLCNAMRSLNPTILVKSVTDPLPGTALWS